MDDLSARLLSLESALCAPGASPAALSAAAAEFSPSLWAAVVDARAVARLCAWVISGSWRVRDLLAGSTLCTASIRLIPSTR